MAKYMSFKSGQMSNRPITSIMLTLILTVTSLGVWNTVAYSAELTVSDSISTTNVALPNGIFSVQQFDPSLGTLLKVLLTLEGTADLQFSFFNTTENSGTVSRGFGATINLAASFGALAVNPDTNDIVLAVGPKDTVSGSDSAFDVAGKVIIDNLQLADLTGFGFVDIGVSIGMDIRGSISSGLTGNVQSTNTAEATIYVVYVYDPVEPLPEDVIDHFTGYEVKEKSKLHPGNVDLVDQFRDFEAVDVEKAKLILVPVDKNDEGVISPHAHLVCYEIKKGAKPKQKAKGKKEHQQVMVANQFGEQYLEIKKVKLLCVPSTKEVVTK